MAKNLFSAAKKAQPAKTTKGKDEKVRVRIEGDNGVSIFDKIEKAEKLQDVMKSSKAKLDMITDELRDLGREEWARLYQKTGRNPESIMIESVNDADDTAQFMVCPSDKYIMINAERAESLRETFCEEIVEEKTSFSFDNEMIEKYGEVLSRLIEESDEITARDKELIIKATTTFSVAKGTIDMLKTYGDVAEVMEAVKPIVSLKNIEVIKG